MIIRARCRAGWILLAGLLSVGNARAAENVPDDLTLIPLETLLQTEVVTASKMARQISDAPSAVAIVTAEDIRAYGYRSLADIINSMRGLYTTYDRAWQYMGGRGFGVPGDFAGRVMILIDGYASADNLYNQVYLDNSGLLDTELIDRVEYVPGTGSVTYGNNAFLGIINVITKKGSHFGGAQVSGEMFSYGGKKGRATFGKQLDNGANVLASASWLDSDGRNLYFPGFDDPATNNGVARHLDYESSQRLFGKIDYEGLSLEGAYVTRKKGIPNGAYGVVFNDYNQYWDTNAFLSARYDTDLSLKLKSSTHAYYGFYLDRGAGQYPTQFWRERNRGQWWGIDQKFVANWFEHHTLMFGAELRDDFEFAWSNPSGKANHDRTTASLYLQDEIALNSHWKTNLGARYDHGSDAGGNVSPRVALMYSPTMQTTLKAAYSAAFRMPAAYEKYYSDGESQFSNPGLQPEHVAATELVLQHEFSPAMRFIGSAYRYRTSDLITFDDTRQQYINAGRSHTKGVELELERSWDGGVRFRGSTAWQEAEDTQGQRLVNSPRNLTKLNLTFPMLSHTLRTGMEVQYMGPRLTAAGRETDSTTITNLTLTTEQAWHGVSASLSIRNLFDDAYDAVAPFVQTSPSGYVQDTMKMDGRNFWLQLTYDFWK